MKQTLLILILTLYLSAGFADPILQGEIKMIPQKTANPKVIDPGTSIAFSIEIENIGNKTNAPGTIFIRYAYANPLTEHNHSELFRTEDKNLPSIKPKEKITIEFKNQHKWPSIFDFIKQNWTMRQYQAEVKIEDKQHTIALASIAFTMHYYPGPNHELPKEFPAKN